MTFFADEGLDASIVEALRALSYKVIYAAEDYISASDEKLLNAARQQEAILVTKDKDFGEMVIRQRLLTHGIVLIRIDELSLQPNVDFIITTLTTYIEKLAGCLTVIQEKRVRIRKLEL